MQQIEQRYKSKDSDYYSLRLKPQAITPLCCSCSVFCSLWHVWSCSPVNFLIISDCVPFPYWRIASLILDTSTTHFTHSDDVIMVRSTVGYLTHILFFMEAGQFDCVFIRPEHILPLRFFCFLLSECTTNTCSHNTHHFSDLVTPSNSLLAQPVSLNSLGEFEVMMDKYSRGLYSPAGFILRLNNTDKCLHWILYTVRVLN